MLYLLLYIVNHPRKKGGYVLASPTQPKMEREKLRNSETKC